MSIEDFYSELLIEYSKDQSYCKPVEEPSFEEELYNPMCGDRVKLTGKVEGGELVELSYQGNGCAISQASSGLLCSLLKGRTVEDARRVINLFERMIQGERSPEIIEELGDAKILEGVSKLPGRHRCALLAWENLKNGIED